MLKALKKLGKKLGPSSGSSKPAELQGGSSQEAAAAHPQASWQQLLTAGTPTCAAEEPPPAAVPAGQAAAARPEPPAAAPTAVPRAEQGAAASPAATPAAEGEEEAGPSSAFPQPHHAEGAVDYSHDEATIDMWGRASLDYGALDESGRASLDYGAGPLELDGGSPAAGGAQHEAPGQGGAAGAALGAGSSAAECEEAEGGLPCEERWQEHELPGGRDGEGEGVPCGEGTGAGAGRGGDEPDLGGEPARASLEAAASAEGEGAGDGEGDGPCAPISDPLAAMVYLTEEGEAGDDALSVLSDGLTEDELAEELSELEQALSALEGEALFGSSPGNGAGAGGAGGPGMLPSPGSSGGGLDRMLSERLGLSPGDDADPSVYAKQMVKLYTNLGLKLMDARKFEEALALMRKAEALVENDGMWGGAEGAGAAKRKRLQAITYNNLGCLFKRRNHPQLALQYLMRALALEEETGHVQNSSSTHLNICAAYSSLKKYKESLAHAERAIVLLQRQLWPPGLSFQDGLLHLSKVLSTAGDKRLLSGVNVLGIAYHNAALEHERLGRVREAHVCFARASTLATKCLGPRAALTSSLQRALKAFLARQQQGARGRAGGGAGTPRAGGASSTQVKVRQTSPKRGASRAAHARPPPGPRTSASRSSLAASSARGPLALDKGSRSFSKSGSTGKLSEHGSRR